MDAVRTGGELPPATPDDDAVQNAIIYAEIKDRSAADVKADAAASWVALRQAIESASSDELARPHPRFPEYQIWGTVPGAVGHSGTHTWSWLLDVGQEERAIEVAKWESAMEGDFFTTPEQLADSRYNLACVYARVGRAEEAVQLLREAVKAKPEQAAWARKDRDFDSIRQRADFQALLDDETQR